jgi:hypothetical protein
MVKEAYFSTSRDRLKDKRVTCIAASESKDYCIAGSYAEGIHQSDWASAIAVTVRLSASGCIIWVKVHN